MISLLFLADRKKMSGGNIFNNRWAGVVGLDMHFLIKIVRVSGEAILGTQRYSAI